MIETIKAKAKQLKKQVIIVYLAYMHKDVQWYIKMFLLLLLLYAFSPIDLIPDFIPVLGMLDEMILIPLGVIIAMKMIPESVWTECKEKAEKGVTVESKYQKIGAVLILTIWGVVLASFIF
ncbi:MAG: YkvA family protein [Desulfitobacterium sp.]